MGVSTIGASGIALLSLTGSGTVPQWIAIGTGSATFAVGQTDLVTENQRKIYASRDAGTQKKVGWVTDFDSLAMSGITLTEFGLFNNATTGSGDMFQRENLQEIVFDGTNELQIELELEVFEA